MNKSEKEDFFSPQRRFSDSIGSHNTFILDEDMDIFGKLLRAGSVIRIIAWREVNEVPYLVINKGTWESLIEYSRVFHLLKK
jgi:hypothetical protein